MAYKMRLAGVLAILAVFALVILPPATADSPPPVTTLTVNFEQNSVPVNDTIQFTLNCSAYECGTGGCEEGEAVNGYGDVYSITAVCPSSGCFMTEYRYEDYPSLTSCDFTGEMKGEQMVILNLAHPFSCTSFNGNSRSCDLHINLASATITHPGTPAINATPLPDNAGVVVMSTPQGPAQPESLLDSILCFFKTVFGGTC